MRWTRSASLTNFARVARQGGLDPQRLLAEFRLPEAALHEQELKVPIDRVRSMLEAAAERSGFEAFGLLMAETRRLSNLGPLGLLMREQPTLHKALEVLVRYGNRMNDALHLTLENTGDVVVLREEIMAGDSGPIRQSTELAIGVAFLALQTVLGDKWKPRRVCFAHDAPANRAVHHRVFGRIVEFGHDFNGIVCARRDLELENAQADPVHERYARELVEAAFSGRMQETMGQVRQLVVTLLGSGPCTIEVAAKRLGMTRRTVHRRLAAEGQTFSAIVDDVRRELATRYLADARRPLAEISDLLGFAAPSGFSRWHRRHFKRPASRAREGRAPIATAARRRAKPARASR